MKHWILTLILVFGALAKAQDYDYSELREDIVYNGKIANPKDPISNSTVKIKSFGRFFCSGTLITPRLVLSAAHCADQLRGASVEVAGQEVAVDDYRIHPKTIQKRFLNISESIYYDLLLISLHEPIRAPGVAVALPRRGDRISTKEELLLAGYGCINRIGKPDNGRLSYAIVKSTRYVKPGKDESVQINTSGASCQGDSGGSVYGLRNNRLTLLGVISWGDTLGFVNRSEVVESHLDWIEQAAQDLRSGTVL